MLGAAVRTEWLDNDYYYQLGVPETASDAEIRAAYRRLARRFHPDAHPRSSEAEARFKQITAAYYVLGDPVRRQQYDDVRRAAALTRFGGQRPGWAGWWDTKTWPFAEAAWLSASFTAAGAPAAGRPPRGQNIQAELTLGFEEAAAGTTAELDVAVDEPCPACQGSGAAPGSWPVSCPDCGGAGQVSQPYGPFALAQLCRRCAGQGRIVEHCCDGCGGAGSRLGSRRVRLRVPAGVEDGQRIRLPGRGHPGRPGGRPGDLQVTVRVSPHPLFGRDGLNLTLRLPVTFPEAALGACLTVPALNGAVTVEIPPGTPSGRTLTLPGRGLADDHGQKRGDLVVVVEIAVPRELDEEERQAVETLAAVLHHDPRPHLKVSRQA